MDRFQEEQQQVFSALENDSRLTASAKAQVALFQTILGQEPNISFDTTSALLYGFLRNEAFTERDSYPVYRAWESRSS